MIPIGEPFPDAEPGPGQENPVPAGPAEPCCYCTPIRSTTKMRVSFGLITPPAPREP